MAQGGFCVEGLELRLPQGRDTDLTATFGPRGASAAIRAQVTTERVTCALEPPAAR